MKRSSLLLLLMLLVANHTLAQKFEMGKVSARELQESVHPTDTSAVAAVLYKKGKSSFFLKKDIFSLVHDIEFRIKIYKKEGLDLATYEIPYFTGYENLNPDYVTLSDAATYNLEGGKVVKTKLGGEGKFSQKINNNVRTLSITLPNVKVGSIIEFRYSLKTEDIGSFPNFSFQSSIPHNFVSYRTEIPAAYQYRVIRNGVLPIKTESKIGTAQQSVLNEHNQYDMQSYKQVESTFELRDIPALKNELYVDNINNYRASIDHELEAVRWDGVPEKKYSNTWDDVARHIYDSKNFGKQLALRGFFEDDLRKILTPEMNRSEKIAAILKFLQSTMTWNGEMNYLTHKGIKEAYMAKSGNIGEINLLLVSFLNTAGIISSPVVLSTVDNGVATLPGSRAFNYVVASVEDEGKTVLLDAANKYSAPGIIPTYALNWTGRKINANGSSEEINLQPQTPARYNVIVMAELTADGKIKGQARISHTDHLAFDFREEYAKMVKEQYLETLENTYYGIRVSNYERTNEKQNETPVTESFDFSSDNVTERIGTKMYVNPMLFFAQTRNPFTAEKRNLPVFFGYPKANRYNIKIKLPEGFAVESLPSPLSISTGEGVATFRYNIQQTGDMVELLVTADTSKMLVSSDFYPVLRDYYSKYTAQQSEKLVLTKK